jgi:hypothetical protein
MNRSLWRALAGAVASAPILTGCQTSPLASDDTFCAKPAHHCVNVLVDATANTIVAVPDTLRKPRGDKPIRWKIINAYGQTFEFPPTGGIVFLTGNFQCRRDDSDHQSFLCSDEDGIKGDYKYTVTVTGGSPNPPPYDPHVVNN